MVEQDAALGLRQHHQRQVGRRQRLEWRQLQERVVPGEPQATQVLTVLT